jgi:protein arginine N-methyltransferase 1
MFPLQSHLLILKDKLRLSAYRQAIFKAVRRGDVVVDIGTGTGILAFLAVQAGAKKVYAIEYGSIIDVARKMAADNGYSDRICFTQGTAGEVDIPERADVIVTETIGSFGIDEGIMDLVLDARKRFLKPGGIIVPQKVRLQAVPVNIEHNHPFRFLSEAFNNLETEHLSHLAANNVYRLLPDVIESLRILSQPTDLFEANLFDCDSLDYPLKMAVEIKIESSGNFDGIIVFPDITVGDGIKISLFDNGRPVSSSWQMMFFPIMERTALNAGDRVAFEVTLTEHNGFIWEHHICKGHQKKAFRHLSLFGAPSLYHLLSSK